MKFIWDLIGYGVGAMGLFAWFISQTPLYGWLWSIVPPAAEGIMWYANNLEIVFPIAAFFIISDMNPRKILLGGGIAVAIGIALYFMGF